MLALTRLLAFILFSLGLSDIALSYQERGLTFWGQHIVGNTTALPGATKDYSPGRCTLCHAFTHQPKSHYYIGPNLSGITDRAAERLKDPRYHRGNARARITTIKEAFPGAGTATTPLEYLAESLLCVSCYVVPGYGVPGTHDQESPEIEVTQPPYNLRLDDLVAVINWLYINDGKTPPATPAIQAALMKFLTPLEKQRLTNPSPDLLLPKNPTVFASGEETLEDLFDRPQCAACHEIPGIPGAVGSIGPPLKMGTLAEERLKDPTYKGAARTPREYVIESILYPRRHVAQGLPDNVMPAVYETQLTPLAVERMADYLLNLKDGMEPAIPVQTPKSTKSPFFPPYRLATRLSLHDYYAKTYSDLLVAAKEESLLDKFGTEVVRFVWHRSQDHPIVIRIDVDKDSAQLTAKELEGWDTEAEPFHLLTTQTRALSRQEWQTVTQRLDEADFWNLGLFERFEKDGAGWLTERVKEDRYHVVHMRSPEMGQYRAACLYLLKLSGLNLDPIY